MSLMGDLRKKIIFMTITRSKFRFLNLFSLLFVFSLALGIQSKANALDRLDIIRQRGLITAGISYEILGFSRPDRRGNWEGIDVDFMRAAAVALFGDERRVQFIQVGPNQQFEALSSGKVDILASSLPRDFYEKLLPQVIFIPPLFYDTSGFLTPRELGLRSPLQVNGLRVCIADVPELLEGMVQFYARNNMKVISLVKGTLYAAGDSYIKNKCDAFFARRSQLLGFLKDLNHLKLNNKFLDLSFPISELSASVMARNHSVAQLLYCVRNTLIFAEQLGITSENIQRLQESQNPNYDFFIKTTVQWGSPLNLPPNWAHLVIQKMGNYRQIYRRSFSSFKAWNLIEGLNLLKEDGGHIEQIWQNSTDTLHRKS